MPGSTPNGFPYAIPEDKRINWPATSQQLAEKLDVMAAGLPGVIDCGVHVGPNAVSGPVEATVVFSHLFDTPPIVVCTAAQDQNGIVTVKSVARDSFTVTFQPAPGQALALVRFNWIAASVQ